MGSNEELKKIKKIVMLINDKKGEKIIVLDLKNLTWITDYFIITSGDSLIQTKAIAENIIENFKQQPISIEGLEDGKWIVIDYGEIIIHIFLEETRNYYKLEKLWADAKVVEV
ncbi:MAG: ribosome silencing factor [Candidatus Omnitrophica bacterium]|nr:ribosome silencing factor [Candidatus Omnitrophota bacterium]MCM8802086.1 ribosome silencing factor [Candidatus Omnitrophota bacterium]